MKPRRATFEPAGPLALAPEAFGTVFEFDAVPTVENRGRVAIVDVYGPLMHHAGWLFDSYEAITSRIAAALESKPDAVVLRLDSPGGLVAGMLEAAQTIRSMARGAGIEIVAFVDGSATSAAYALACACDRIVVSPTALLGSIGVMETLTDATAQAQMRGLKHRLITSGARKGDGHPGQPLSDEAAAAKQELVGKLAAEFFAHVAAMRSLESGAVEALQASVIAGSDAVALGLADEVGTFDELLATLASGAHLPAPAATENDMTDEETARKALQAILDDKDGDDKAKAKARKALSAMDDDGEETENDDEKESKKAKAAKAEGDDDEEPKGSDDDDKKEARAADPRLDALEAEFRAQLIDGRPDLSAEQRSYLSDQPLASVRGYLVAHPRAPRSNPAATAVVGSTRGAGQGDAPTSETDPELAALDRAMGLDVVPAAKAERRGNVLYLGRAPATLVAE